MPPQPTSACQPALSGVFAKYYVVEAQEHGYENTKTPSGIMWLELIRLWVNWFFYLGPALSLPFLIGFLLAIKQRRLWIVLAVTLTTGSAVAFCIFTQAHYFSPATVAVYLFIVEGLRYLWEQGTGERAFVVAVCVTTVVASLGRQTGSTAMNSTFMFPNVRSMVAQKLEHQTGKQLVLVSYDLDRHYPGDELVHNGADFDSEKILWARSKGPGRDSDLCSPYQERSFWSVITDDTTFSLRPLDLCKSKDEYSRRQLKSSY